MKTLRLTLAKGVNNIHDNVNLGDFDETESPTIDILKTAENIDIDDLGLGRLRLGRTRKLAVSNAHSFFAHPKNPALAYFVVTSTLKKFNTDFTATTIATLSNNSRLCYELVNDEVVISNGSNIGWLTGTTYTAFNPTLDGVFEAAMPAGQFLAFCRGCLIVAKDNMIYVSKPWNAEVRDTRLSEFPMDGTIRMLGGVEDGVWLATDKHVSFMQGKGSDEWEFVHKSDFVPPKGCYGKGFIRGDKTAEQIVYWASNGFCTGKAGGVFENLSEGMVRLPSGEYGSCFRREYKGLYQYLAVIGQKTDNNITVADDLEVNTIYN